ncbi:MULTISPECIES: heavy metal translocating P-type ATPase [unclassified Sphingobacterium]|uniref:heavy metal translocating P-type ATPase n=1 Tax=unclassified Sphingobacterium TaxID=2609468 RepID=UPI0020C2A2E9|nr:MULTISPECIES: heavy metal translocating P-type ATPase [unclassified Sphingobacterium]
MDHKHIFDKDGNCEICSQTVKVYKNANADDLLKQTQNHRSHQGNNSHKLDHQHAEDDGHDHEHNHSHDNNASTFELFRPAIISFVFLISGILFDYVFHFPWFQGWLRLVWYLLAYLPVGLPVLKDAFKSISKGNFFSEFFLMGIATIGAFAIGEYPEGVAVMLFYSVGEAFQTMAVSKAKANIKSLLDQRPDEATVLRNGKTELIKAELVKVGDIVQLKPGEKLALDGKLISVSGTFNTAALTGESKPDSKAKGDSVLAGMINLQTVSEVEITTVYEDSKLSKILEMVQHASTQKAPTELFISKFAKIYTPIVVFLAIGIALIPYFFVADYVFQDWLYRALIFLVVSCPCALVISIPLGYFGGIGAASRHGILVKGGNFLDTLAAVKHVVMDKTGTMTEGVFKVNDVKFDPSALQEQILEYVNEIESKSTHPVATAIHEYVGEVKGHLNLDHVEEIAGHGLKAKIDGKEVLVGNFKLLDQHQVSYPNADKEIVYTTIAIAVDRKYIGYISIADKIKDGAQDTINALHSEGIKVTMLSGDKSTVVNEVAKNLKIDSAYGDLLPEDKVEKLKEVKARDRIVAFVGDGVNDAPVVALSDVGIAMGGLGSDATIETADVVIQDDRPIKIPMSIKIGRKTKKIVWQNIGLAFAVKAIVLILGAGGVATMWEAVFADVGVALLAILNAVRIQRTDFSKDFNKI